MTVIIQGDQVRSIALGLGPVSKASGTLASSAISLFTVAGGEVLITSVYLKATTAITTDGGTVALQSVQTTGGTQTLVTATDLGTTDTAIGAVVGLDQGSTAASKFLIGGRVDLNAVVSTGTIKILPSSANGAVTVYVTWVPITSGASLVAA